MSIDNKRKAIIFLAIFLPILAIIYPIVKNTYIKPELFKRKCIKDAKSTDEFKVYSDEQIIEYCNCTYEKLKEKYKIVGKFPKSKNYTKSDKEDVLDCIIEIFIADSLKEEYIKKKEEILANYP